MHYLPLSPNKLSRKLVLMVLVSMDVLVRPLRQHSCLNLLEKLLRYLRCSTLSFCNLLDFSWQHFKTTCSRAPLRLYKSTSSACRCQWLTLGGSGRFFVSRHRVEERRRRPEYWGSCSSPTLHSSHFLSSCRTLSIVHQHGDTQEGQLPLGQRWGSAPSLQLCQIISLILPSTDDSCGVSALRKFFIFKLLLIGAVVRFKFVFCSWVFGYVQGSVLLSWNELLTLKKSSLWSLMRNVAEFISERREKNTAERGTERFIFTPAGISQAHSTFLQPLWKTWNSD